MTIRHLNDRGINLNTIILVLGVVGSICTVVRYVAPLETYRGDMSGVQNDMHLVKTTQAVQTAALQTLAQVARDSQDLRALFERYSAETTSRQRELTHDLDSISRRLERLEPK